MVIVINGAAISAPVIQDKISDGRVMLVGNFSYSELAELVIILRSSSLAEPFSILEKRVITPAADKGVGS